MKQHGHHNFSRGLTLFLLFVVEIFFQRKTKIFTRLFQKGKILNSDKVYENIKDLRIIYILKSIFQSIVLGTPGYGKG